MDVKECIKEIKELRKYLGALLLDPEDSIEIWHKRVVFRMNYWAAQIRILEERYDRIGISIPPEDFLYQLYNREFDNAYEQWLESIGNRSLYRELRQLETDLQTYMDAQDKWKQQTIKAAIEKGDQQLKLMM